MFFLYTVHLCLNFSWSIYDFEASVVVLHDMLQRNHTGGVMRGVFCNAKNASYLKKKKRSGVILSTEM